MYIVQRRNWENRSTAMRKNNKVTYVSLFGIQEASGQVKRLSEEAVSLICGLRQKNEFLCTLIQELVSRRK